MNSNVPSIDFSPLISELDSYFSDANTQPSGKAVTLIYGKMNDVSSSNQFNSLNEISSTYGLNIQAAYHAMVFGWVDSPNSYLKDYDTIIIPYKNAESYNCSFYELKPDATPIVRPNVANPVRTQYLSSKCNLIETVSFSGPVLVKANVIHNIKPNEGTADIGEFITILLPAGQFA